jgi:hypothetical protein
MKIEQARWTAAKGWEPEPPHKPGGEADLVLVFAGTAILKNTDRIRLLRAAYPSARLLGCSTSGEICGRQVADDSLVVTAVALEHSRVDGACISIRSVQSSFVAGQRLAEALARENLVHVFVLSDGLKVNGSDLARGLTSILPPGVTITGGLSGDGERFQETLVLWGEKAEPDCVAAVGFYGNRLKVGYGSVGGWDPFGPERLITRSSGNVLYELDGTSAMVLYKKYLGEHAKGLPATGLLFPLALRAREGQAGLVRTILSVSEEDQSMTFAGDVPEGAYAQLMKANFDRLIDGAVGAARASHETIGSVSPELAVLISCVGRRMVLRQRVEEEVEGVAEVLGPHTIQTGFYSYGELSPFRPSAQCELHNQTMTITTFRET